MNMFEKILFAILFVIALVVTFDFVVYVIKSAPKTSYFSKRTWYVGLFALMALVFWYINEMKFC